MSKEKQILKLGEQGYSQRKIAAILSISRNTVSLVLDAAKRRHISAQDASTMKEQELFLKLFPEKASVPVQMKPNFELIHKELLRAGVTLKLLWEEYTDTCRQAKQPPYMYSQFCKLYSDYVDHNRLTMHIQHKPGDKCMVDWAGTKLHYFDSDTNETCSCHLFVAALPFSMYCYAEVCHTMKAEDWINAHIRMYEFFGGTTRLLVCDNLKTGIIRNRKHEDPVFNQSYSELAEHYKTALLPTRVLSPRDKAAVEGSVGQLTSRIIGKLRNQKYFSLAELNKAVRKELELFNQKDFQKREGSRYSVFMQEEKEFLQVLPKMGYEFAQWKKATVQLNYHVLFDHRYYSVPYAYVRKKVDIRSTKSVVEVFYQGTRISSHRRLYGSKGAYDTNLDHMPANHQLYSEWNRDRFQLWADSIGPSAKAVIDKIFASYRVEEQAYKGCLSLLKLADKYSADRLENACTVALAHVPNPRYKNIRLILQAGQDKLPEPDSSKQSSSANLDQVNRFTHLRGAAYYGGEHHE